MTVFKGINVRLNAVEKLDNIFVLLILSLLCSILPLNMTVVFGAVLLIGQCYGIGIETAGFAALLLLLLMILFIRFNTKDTLALLLTPIAFVLKIPAVIPMGYGLVRTPASAVSTGCGVVVYYFMELVREKMPLLQSADKKEVKDILQNLKVLLDGVVKNQDMLMYIIAFTAVILLVYILRRLSVEYAWYIAILSGSVAYVVVMIAGGLFLDVKIRMLPLILGTLAAAVIGVIMEFFLFHVDYAMMKRLQFEDDEYYYYVKAVPKISVAEQKAAARAIRKKVPHDVSNEHSEEISGEIPEEDSENTDIPVEAPMEDVDFESKLEESLKNL